MPTMKIDKPQAKEIAADLPRGKLTEIMKLRSKGFSNYDISEQLDLPYPHVVAEAIKLAVSHEYSDPKKLKRRLEEARLEHLFQQAYNAFASTGTTEWYDRLIKTSERKSKLLGLDAPAEQVITGAGGGPIKIASGALSKLSDKELEAMEVMLAKVVADNGEVKA